jgi:hypothetical protein
MWALRTASFRHLKNDSDRQAVIRSLQEIQNVGAERKTAFDIVDDAARLRLIGCNIGAFGDGYLAKYPDQAAWLAGKGLTEADAVSNYAAWRAEQLSHPFWEGIGKQPHGDDDHDRQR